MNEQQEVSNFDVGMNLTTRQLLDSQRPTTKKNLTTIKELLEYFTKHSREYPNPREDATIDKGDRGNENLGAIMAKLDNMDWLMT